MTIAATAPAQVSPARRRGFTPLTPMRQMTAKSMRRLAGHMQQTHPDMTTAQHLRDAARVLEAGNEEAAQRHLRAAAFTLSPQSLMRHGLHTDDAHIAARQSMHGVHRHLLLVKDIVDAGEKNRAAINRDSYGDNPANLPPRPQPQPDPNAGYGPGALAQKPTVRQPPGNQALNAPARTNSGGSDPAVADPNGPQPRGSKQFARTWDEIGRVIDMTRYPEGSLPMTDAIARAYFGGKVPETWTLLAGGIPSVIDLTGDAKHRHIPGSPLIYEHGLKRRAVKRPAQMSWDWDDLASVIELTAGAPRVINLVGPHGYIHGWIFVGIPGVGDEVNHPSHGHGTVTATAGGKVKVSFDSGHSEAFPVRPGAGATPGHFERMTDDELDRELNDSAAGSGTGSSRFRAAAAEMDRREERAKTARVKALYAEKPKTEADRNRVYQGLVNEGEDPQEAWEHAHGTDPEAMRKQAAIQDLRNQGYKGASLSALARAAYKDEVRRRTVMAENATNGYMLNPKGKQAGIDPYSLFTGPESRARKYASPELKEWFDQNGRPTAADFQAQLIGRKAGMKPADFYASVTWDDLSAVIELSARTAQLEITPAPRGKPGGPGLYDVQGMGHTDYLQQIVKALIEKRGMDPHRAYAVARGAIRKWAAGGSGVHPEVRAAAGAAEAGELARQTRAKAVHGHAATWDQLGRAVELATVLDFFNPAGNPGQARVPAGQVGAGRFTKGSSQQQAKGGQQPKGKPAAKGKTASKGKPGAHQRHLAHLAHLQHNAKVKAGLLATAKSDRARAGALIRQRAALQQALASASGKTNSGQAGSKTAANATTASSAPATTASAASAGSASSAPTAGIPASGSLTAAQGAQIQSQIDSLTTQINGLLQSAKQAQAQAAKL